MIKKRIVAAVASSVVLSFVAADAHAGARMVNPSDAPHRIASQPARPAVAANAVRERWIARDAIVIDETTGKVRRPTSAETESLVRSLRQMFARTASVVKPSANARGLAIDGGVPNVVVARATADGQMETRCVQTFDEAVQYLGLVPQTGAGN